MCLNSRRAEKWQSGFTLIEVLIAIAITGLIAVISYSAFQSSADSNQQAQEVLTELDTLDRAWQRMAADFRNLVIARGTRDADGEEVMPLSTEVKGEYTLRLLRAGRPNLQYLPRTSVQRVGYRLVDGVLWRDSLEQGLSTDDVAPVQVDLLHNIDSVRWRFLPLGAATVDDSGWVDEWPRNAEDEGTLPLGVEIIIEGKAFGELRRVYSLLPGTSG